MQGWYYDPWSLATTVGEPAAGADLSARPFVWSPDRNKSAYDQNCTFRPGSGRAYVFSRYGGPAATEGTYAFRVTTRRDRETIVHTVSASHEADTGEITVNHTVSQMAALDADTVYMGVLWRTDGDDNTDDLASVILRPPSL